MSEFTSDYKGFVSLDRRMIETEWFTGCSPSTVCLMVYLLFTANHKSTTWKGIQLKRGEVLCSIGSAKSPGRLMEETNLPNSTIRDSIKRLKGLGEIEVTAQKGYHGYTLIKIVNYDLYMCSDKNTDKKPVEKTDKKSNKNTVDSKEVKKAEEFKEYKWDDDE